MILGLDLFKWMLLIQATGQWSLTPRSKTPAETILSMLFNTIKSIKVDLAVFFWFGLVGSVINCKI